MPGWIQQMLRSIFILKSQFTRQTILKIPINPFQKAWTLKRILMKSFISKASKQALCVHTGNITFWNSVDNHYRTCERFIGKMSKCLLQCKFMIVPHRTQEGKWIDLRDFVARLAKGEIIYKLKISKYCFVFFEFEVFQ